MIRLKNLSFKFSTDSELVLRRINLEFAAGELALVCGPTGSGKSTLLKTINGLAPHFTGGTLGGEIWISGKNVTGLAPHELAAMVGYVNQQPEGSFVAETVDQEIAYGLEQLGKSQDFMFSRVEELARLLGISGLLRRPLLTLSGGEQQRVAIASALAAGATTLLLDEPTSALDVSATVDILHTLRSLASEQHLTVLLAEHRIEKLLESADSLTVVHGDGTATQGPLSGENLDSLFNNHRMTPTVVEISHFLGWSPTALTVGQAKTNWLKNPPRLVANTSHKKLSPKQQSSPTGSLGVAFEVNDLVVNFGDKAIENLSTKIISQEITAVMGPNGSGKTTLLWALAGELEPEAKVSGTISPLMSELKPKQRLEKVAVVPQRAADLLFLNTLAEELAESDRHSNQPSGTTSNRFAKLTGRIDPRLHPRDLSAGQQLALVIAIQLAKNAEVLILDEPTRGLDYVAKRHLAAQLLALRDEGKTIIVASHDVEFVAQIAGKVLVLERGQIAADARAIDIFGGVGPLQSDVAAVVSSDPRFSGVNDMQDFHLPINLLELQSHFAKAEAKSAKGGAS